MMDSGYLKSVKANSSEELFNINKLTPGTEFMDKLDRHISYFIKYQISDNIDWQVPKVIFTGKSNLNSIVI